MKSLLTYITENKNIPGAIVYRGMEKNQKTDKNVWVTDNKEYALYFSEQKKDAVVKKFILPKEVCEYLWDEYDFEEVINEYDAWQEIPDDSPVWDDCEDEDEVQYDLMHDLCFPSEEQISILKKEGCVGYMFNYFSDGKYILIFDGTQLIPCD